jgi:hypothetical protein
MAIIALGGLTMTPIVTCDVKEIEMKHEVLYLASLLSG